MALGRCLIFRRVSILERFGQPRGESAELTEPARYVKWADHMSVPCEQEEQEKDCHYKIFTRCIAPQIPFTSFHP